MNEITDELDVLPCPFCGESPRVLPSNPEITGNAWGAVECSNTSCVTFDERELHGVRVEDGEEVADDRGSDGYKAVAISRWNNRQ